MPKNVDLGFYNGDYPAWGLEKEFESFEVESRYFPSKVLYSVLAASPLGLWGQFKQGGGEIDHVIFVFT